MQCEAQASLSALRRELVPPTALELWLLLQLSSLLRVPYVRMLSTLRSGLLGSSFAVSPLLR